MDQARLVISGPKQNRTILLNPKGTTLGRGSTCDVVLDSSSVSRIHAQISQDPFGRWIIEDLNSQNGVLVEGRKVEAQALRPEQEIFIRPFTLRILYHSSTQATTGTPIRGGISVIDKGLEEDIVSYRADQASILSADLMQHLNEFTGRLLQLSSPSELYAEASMCLGKTLDTLIAVVRLPTKPEPLPQSPDLLACCFGNRLADAGALEKSQIHLSKRVLDAVRTTDAPVMASSGASSGRNLGLTIVDEHKPHLVFAAQVSELGETVDALYIDILESKSPKEMFDFVEAIARQINFAQKNLFLAELTKQEKALREANEQLKQKDRIKDEYVSRVTHDIKGHLAAIQSCLLMGAGKIPGIQQEQQSEFLDRAIGRTSQVTDFVKELLNLTRMRLSGKFQMEAFSLKDTIANALSTVERKSQDKSILLTSNVDASIDQMVGNQFSITELITNLLFNALKYTPEGKTVHLNGKALDRQVQIDISDTGIGIPADEVPHVFDEFFRATNAKASGKEGTGLGLSIVKQIVEQHNGTISVTSDEGQGTTFTIMLPTDNPASN